MQVRNLTLAGGVLAVMGGAGHLIGSTLMRREVWGAELRDGVRGTVSLSPTADQLGFAETFWFSVGSFGAPLIALGGLVTWLHRNGQRVPGFVGWTIGLWALSAGVLGGFDTGTLMLLLVGVLISAGDLPIRERQAASAS